MTPNPNWPTMECLRQAYLQTEVSIDLDGTALPAWQAVEHLAGSIFVITAWNPRSVQLDPSENLARNDELKDVLDDRGATVFDALGCAPDDSWYEASFAIVGLGRRAALSIGKQFGQEAIFELTADEQVVHGCFSRWERRRPIEDPYRPDGVNLATTTEAVFGWPATATFRRARGKGWRYEGDPELACRCGGALHLFGRTLASAGRLYDAMAVVCNAEQRATVVNLSDPRFSMLDAWRSFHLARDDADGQGLTKRTRWVYAGGLSDATDPKSTDLPWIYVGETGRTPEERWQQHLDGYKASRWVHRYGGELRPDLYEQQPILRTMAEAVTYEAYLERKLSLEGYPTKGGH